MSSPAPAPDPESEVRTYGLPDDDWTEEDREADYQ